MMRSLNKYLGISAEVLLNEPGARFPDGMQNLERDKFPVVEMAKRCWLQNVKNQKENAEELMRKLIIRAGGVETVPFALFRQVKGARYNSKMDTYALTAWCIRVIALAWENPLKNKYKTSACLF